MSTQVFESKYGVAIEARRPGSGRILPLPSIIVEILNRHGPEIVGLDIEKITYKNSVPEETPLYFALNPKTDENSQQEAALSLFQQIAADLTDAGHSFNAGYVEHSGDRSVQLIGSLTPSVLAQ